jgi:hypothetical protein
MANSASLPTEIGLTQTAGLSRHPRNIEPGTALAEGLVVSAEVAGTLALKRCQRFLAEQQLKPKNFCWLESVVQSNLHRL